MATGYLPLVLVLTGCLVAFFQTEAGEVNESESLSFEYNPISHNLVVKTFKYMQYRKCYIITLTDDERVRIHDSTEMIAIEMKYIAMLVAVGKPTTADHLRRDDKNKCGHAAWNITVEYFTIP